MRETIGWLTKAYMKELEGVELKSLDVFRER
jgi:hypothetical protein